MQLALSLYHGGLLVNAAESDYTSSRELGLVCPFCKESVLLVKSHSRGEVLVSAAWRHYKLSVNSSYCENRALSKDGMDELKQLQKQAQNQRLRLFNRRFWDIFKYNKAIPLNLRATCTRLVGEETLDRMVKHCWERWDVEEILKTLPSKINFRLNNPQVEEYVQKHPALQETSQEVIDEVLEQFVHAKFSTLRLKILSEVIEWLATPTALESFAKLVCLAFIDCLEALPPPIHSSVIAEMMLVSLTLTDWEKAIASLEDKNRGIGFGNSHG